MSDNKKVFITPVDYYYLKKQNAIKGQINLSTFNHRNEIKEGKSHFVKENITFVGAEFCQRKNKKIYFFGNEIFLPRSYQFIMKYKEYHKAENDLKRKSNNIGLQINLIKNLSGQNQIFIGDSPLSSVHRINIQLSNKSITNFFEKNLSSAYPNEIITNLPDQDTKMSLKISYDENFIYKNFSNSCLNLSSALVKSVNSFYLKNKFFIRKLFSLNNYFHYQINCGAANLINMSPKINNLLKVHEKLYIYNFKGIINPSPKITVTSQGQNAKPYSYMLGNTSYFMLCNKVLLKDFPLLGSFNIDKDGFKIMPFGHFVTLYTNNNLLRMSSGIGITVLSKLFAFEVIYTPYVKKEITDIHSKFHVKFGID